MTKSPDAFRTISEVAEWLGVQAHVLRFWESKFSQVRPVKRAGGRRYYRPADMQLLGGIKALLYEDGLTIKGVQKMLREQGVTHISGLSQSLDESASTIVADIEATVVSFDAAPVATAIPVLQENNETLPATASVPLAPEEPAIQEELSLALPAEPAVEPESELGLTAENAEESETETIVAVSGTEPNPEPEPKESTPKPNIISGPVPLPHHPITYVQGTLTQLVRIKRLSPELANQIRPVAKDLEAWLSRSAGNGQT